MDAVAEIDLPSSTEAVFVCVADLEAYAEWLDIVARAQTEEASSTTPSTPPAWVVDLRGRLGPLARSKRLRMARTECEPSRWVRFERQESDGRSHSPWVLTAAIAPTDMGSHLTMRLHYGGRFWGPVLERLLNDEIERAKPRLLAVLDGG